MIIKRTFNGKEYEIELTKEEMESVIHELDIDNLTECVRDYIEELQEDSTDENAQKEFQEYLRFTNEQKEVFLKKCAKDILFDMQEQGMTFNDDLTDIFKDTITNNFKNINICFEREER